MYTKKVGEQSGYEMFKFRRISTVLKFMLKFFLKTYIFRVNRHGNVVIFICDGVSRRIVTFYSVKL